MWFSISVYSPGPDHFVAVFDVISDRKRGEEEIRSLNASLVHPREIFKTALQESAAALILVHNHPSGDPAPSDEDIAITKNVVKAGELLGIEVLDHVIVTQHGHFSFAESGEAKSEPATS